MRIFLLCALLAAGCATDDSFDDVSTLRLDITSPLEVDRLSITAMGGFPEDFTRTLDIPQTTYRFDYEYAEEIYVSQVEIIAYRSQVEIAAGSARVQLDHPDEDTTVGHATVVLAPTP